MLDIISQESAHADNRPLPLIVAEKWGFALAHVQENNGFWFAVQDWIVGLLITQTRDASKVWNDLKRRSSLQLSDSIRTLPYEATDGKTYSVEYTTDKGLYLIAQHLRATRERPVLREIREFLAKSGAFVDLVRREPDTLLHAMNPDKLLDAVIEEYKRQGKDDTWINARINGKIKRAMFTTALKTVIVDVSEKHFGLATNEVYMGLWGRNADQLKLQMNLNKYASLRDNQPTLALSYQGIAEEVSAKRLGVREELTWDEARVIVREVADLVGIQAQATSHYLQIDLATGQPLLTENI